MLVALDTNIVSEAVKSHCDQKVFTWLSRFGSEASSFRLHAGLNYNGVHYSYRSGRDATP